MATTNKKKEANGSIEIHCSKGMQTHLATVIGNLDELRKQMHHLQQRAAAAEDRLNSALIAYVEASNYPLSKFNIVGYDNHGRTITVQKA